MSDGFLAPYLLSNRQDRESGEGGSRVQKTACSGVGRPFSLVGLSGVGELEKDCGKCQLCRALGWEESALQGLGVGSLALALYAHVVWYA